MSNLLASYQMSAASLVQGTPSTLVNALTTFTFQNTSSTASYLAAGGTVESPRMVTIDLTPENFDTMNQVFMNLTVLFTAATPLTAGEIKFGWCQDPFQTGVATQNVNTMESFVCAQSGLATSGKGITMTSGTTPFRDPNSPPYLTFFVMGWETDQPITVRLQNTFVGKFF